MAFDPSLLQMFEEGGWTMFIILGLGLIDLVLAVASAALIARSFVRAGRGALLGVGVTTLLVAALVVGVGVLGWQLGLAQVEEALAVVSPDLSDGLRAEGMRIVVYPLYFGLGMAALPTLTGALAIGRGATMRTGH